MVAEQYEIGDTINSFGKTFHHTANFDITTRI